MSSSKLTRDQKEAIGLLQVGTFLEYFDLSLYIHMAVVLNDLFFPRSDPYASSLLSTFSFCAIWLLRPLGSLIFGWVGDHMGRKSTIVLTTFTMAVSCLLITGLPTYAQIGAAAAWGAIICHALQNFSSVGGILSAEIYLTETNKSSNRYTIAASIAGAAALGNVVALGVTSFGVYGNFEWRYAFFIGSIVTIVGVMVRAHLKETPDFIAAKERKKRNAKLIEDTKTDWRTYAAYFAIDSTRPFFFYFVFIYVANILKHDFSMNGETVVHQNWIASLFALIQVWGLIALTTKFHPMRILGWFRYSGFLMVLALPSLLFMATSPTDILAIQILCLLFRPDYTPAEGFICSQIPILKRLTSMGLLNAASRMIMYPLVTFGLVIITSQFGHYGLWFIAIPLCAGYAWGVKHFRRLAKLDLPLAQSEHAQNINQQRGKIISV